jgi:hypothetical protein
MVQDTLITKSQLLLLFCLAVIFANVFASLFMTILFFRDSLNTISYLMDHTSELTASGLAFNGSKNNLFTFAALEYGTALHNLSHHLTVIWDDKDSYIQIYSYQLPGPLFHLGETIRLLKHAYNIALMYSAQDSFFLNCTRILCNSSFGHIIRAFNLVYGHIYAFGTELGEHEIDNNLIAHSQSIFQRMYQIFNGLVANGVHPRDQLSNDDAQELDHLYSQLNITVTEYLQKPGTIIW